MGWRYARIAALATTLAATVVLCAGFARASTLNGTIYLGMDAPLTGPVAFVGTDNVEIVRKYVDYINAHGGVRGRRLVVDVSDDGSNPTTGLQNLQRFINDSKYLGFIAPGFSSIALADMPIASAAGIPSISMASAAAQVTPAMPYWYMTTATTRLFAYAMAHELRRRNIKKIALVGDNGGFGVEGMKSAKSLVQRFGFDVVNETVFPLTTTDFAPVLLKVKDSGAQALWLWNSTASTVTLVKQFREFQLPQLLVLTGANASPQFLEPVCPNADGALIDSYLGNVASALPKTNLSRARALFVESLLGHAPSTFHFDGLTAVDMFKGAIEIGGFSRQGINTALETKMSGFVGPGGRYYYSKVNHTGLQLNSMIVSRIENCRLQPVAGVALQARPKAR